MARDRRGRHVEEEGHGDNERWLLTYADMITLLMALFIVMFAMSKVDESKFESLQVSLSSAFSGKVFDGGQAIKATGGDQSSTDPSQAAVTALTPMVASSPQARDEQQDFRRLKALIDREVARRHLERVVRTDIEKRGLAVRVMTDGLLFDSGSADVKPGALPLLRSLSRILGTDQVHPVRVEGHTDNVPITGRYPSNWELSGARSSAIVRTLATGRLKSDRFEAVGLAELDPAGSNATASGRAKNRRVEIVLPRRHGEPSPSTPREDASRIRPDIQPSTATEGTR